MHCTDLQVAIVFRAVGPGGQGGGADAPPLQTLRDQLSLSQWDFYIGQPLTKYQIFTYFSKFCVFDSNMVKQSRASGWSSRGVWVENRAEI